MGLYKITIGREQTKRQKIRDPEVNVQGKIAQNLTLTIPLFLFLSWKEDFVAIFDLLLKGVKSYIAILKNAKRGFYKKLLKESKSQKWKERWSTRNIIESPSTPLRAM